MKYFLFGLCFIYVISQLPDVAGYRILGLFPFSGKSHYMLQQPIFQELAKRGHEVTVVVSYEEKNPPPNYNQIVVDRKLIWEFKKDTNVILELERGGFETIIDYVWDGTFFTTEAAFNSSSLQKFIKEDNSHFDLIFTEFFYQPCLYMFAHKYKAPVVAISTFGYMLDAARVMGSPIYLSYMQHEFRKFNTPMSLWNKLLNVYSAAYDLFWTKYHLLPMHQKFAEKHFASLPGPLPRLEDLIKNTSLLFLNTHYSVDTVRPYVPGIVEIGGFHIKKPKPLPSDLQKFLDESKDGVVFFSLGSNMKSKDMARDKIEIFLKVFRNMKQRVLWKFEDDKLDGKPDNVKIGAWLPQNDILAHKNVKVFITHGGLLSTQEAIYHGVPVLGIPFFGDQHLNIEKVEAAGVGIKLNYAGISEELLGSSLSKLLYDTKFLDKASILSEAFRDRPLAAMDSTIYWIEYVIRHKGASFMRSPIVDMSFVETYMLDVIGIIVTVILLFLWLVRVILKTIFCRSSPTKQKTL